MGWKLQSPGVHLDWAKGDIIPNPSFKLQHQVPRGKRTITNSFHTSAVPQVSSVLLSSRGLFLPTLPRLYMPSIWILSPLGVPLSTLSNKQEAHRLRRWYTYTQLCRMVTKGLRWPNDGKGKSSAFLGSPDGRGQQQTSGRIKKVWLEHVGSPRGLVPGGMGPQLLSHFWRHYQTWCFKTQLKCMSTRGKGQRLCLTFWKKSKHFSYMPQFRGFSGNTSWTRPKGDCIWIIHLQKGRKHI